MSTVQAMQGPKKGIVQRLTEKLRRQGNNVYTLPNYPEEKCSERPESLQIDLTAKWAGKKKPKSARKKLKGILDNGLLDLRDRAKTEIVGLYAGFNIDLGKVTVQCGDRSVVIQFGATEKVTLTSTDQKLMERFKELLRSHRLFRQEQAYLEELKTPGTTTTTTVASSGTSGNGTTAAMTTISQVDSTITLTDDFRGWDYDSRSVKVLEAVQEMQQLTVTVLEKSTRCLEEMKAICEEEATLLGLVKPKTTTSAVTTAVPPTTTGPATTRSELLMTARTDALLKATTPPDTSEIEEEDDDDSSEELDEETSRQLMAMSSRRAVLPSLEAARTEAEEQSKREVMTRLRRIIDMPTRTPERTASLATVPAEPIYRTREKEKPRTVQEKKMPPAPPPSRTRRDHLPALQLPGEGIGLRALSLLISRNGLSLVHYEPLSYLQITCEELLWSRLLDQAAASRLPEERMSLVAAFAFSSYLVKTGRNRKPFNPILGETFDYEEAGWRYHGEQVSHHPPITVGHAESKNWAMWSTLQIYHSLSVWNRSVELKMEHPIRVRLTLPDGTFEDYSWQKVRSRVESLTSPPEQRRVSHEGQLLVQSSSRHTARLYFKKMKNPAEVTGDVLAPNDRICYRLHGYWDRHLTRIRTTGEKELLVQDVRRHPDQYGFSQFTMGLNEAEPTTTGLLPPSDSRHRLDMRLLEAGNLSRATYAKQQLETAQRARHSRTTASQQQQQPLWFDLVTDEMTRKQVYYPNGRYWTAKEKKFEGLRGMAETCCP